MAKRENGGAAKPVHGGVDANEGRRKREDQMVDIRKRKHEETLLKKRRKGLENQQQFIASLHPSTVVEKKADMLPESRVRTLYASTHPHSTESIFQSSLDRDFAKRKVRKLEDNLCMVISDNSNDGYGMGIKAIIELGIHDDVEGAPARIAVSELPVETPSIMTDTHLVQYLQHREFVEDTNKITIKEPHYLKIGLVIFSDVQVKHVVERDVNTDSTWMLT
ncbi:hypothetical protein LIER_40601 [Lithospermum erythrorhizon]|uniref:IBB domain-containing protein n=1 Tax=Lithospermum erythrorhizon TaxID=34254 RepID=A0AAV3R044_LITER